MRPAYSCVVAAVLGAPLLACGRYLSLDDDPSTDQAPAEPEVVQTRARDGGTVAVPSSDDGDASTSAPSSVDAAAAPVGRRVFVTSKVYTADDIKGLSGADLECNELAAEGLPALHNRRFVAWLSNDFENARSRLAGTTGPWELVDGTRVADDVAHLLGTNPLANAIDLDEDGEPVDGYAWTGTTRSSTAYGMNCFGWTTASGSGVVGAIVPDASKWTAAKTEDCGAKKMDERPKHHLYCFERVP